MHFSPIILNSVYNVSGQFMFLTLDKIMLKLQEFLFSHFFCHGPGLFEHCEKNQKHLNECHYY
jgi:hypothetical protein